MSDHPDLLDQQIAALESALRLPLPDSTRAQIERDLRELRERRGAVIQGTVNVSGTLHGSAVGVNLGSVQNYYGATSPAPGGQPAASVSQEDINDQRDLLAAHRRTLHIHLKQRAMLGSAYAPPIVEYGIREARAAIRHAKATLRGWGMAADDHPDDEA